MPRALPFLLAAVTLLAASCGSSESLAGPSSSSTTATSSIDPTTFAAQMASSDLYAGTPQEVQLGLFTSDGSSGVSLVTSGTIGMTLSPPDGTSGSPIETTARYVPAPGTQGDASAEPTITTPDVGRGVYQADDVTFDTEGVWTAEATVTLGGTPVSASTQFQVRPEPALPAPGDEAYRTENLTMASKGDPAAIDSRALDGAPVPDPELHQHTIAEAIADEVPALVLFSTPVYCQSQFCGPSTDALQRIADARPNDAYYIHIEIWKDYAKNQVNDAALQWLYRHKELTEPWLYLIGPDGRIVQRWGPLFDVSEVEQALDAVASS